MNTKPKIDIIERFENAIKQRTCIWESDIKLAIEEIERLKTENQELKDKLHIKELNKVKGAE